MKKWICTVLAVLMLPVFSTTAFASGHGHTGKHSRTAVQECVRESTCVNGKGCVRDETCVSNGVCFSSCAYTDKNGDNICDNCGKCSHYQDENEDGTCDHQMNCANRKKEVSVKATGKVGRRNSSHGGRHRNHH